ncbi:membrane protein [Knoellia sinensis KCTC 19936]|uniref:Transport permease protein n=1 Tax=Knoellia sinensis KCTC 19936 TaxID=1385520 RepID=A0A0A0JA09_9MICO|nr:ABC transporter permease [Knoellia sinensis]KGN32877.1 membrane protein [Knoellia sinensis KCTC 19936]
MSTTTATTAATRSTTPTATAAVVRAEARLFTRELGSLFWIVLFPVTLLVILSFIPDFGQADPELGGLRGIDIYSPIAIVMSMILAGTMAMPAVVWAYREAGVLRRLRTTPVRPWSLLIAQMLLHAGAVVVASALVLVVGRLVIGTPLPQSWIGYAVAYVLVLLASFSLGAVVTAIAPNARAGTALGSVVFFASMFTAGVYFPVAAMGGALRDIVELTPLGAATQAMNQAMVGDFPDPKHLIVVAAWAAVLSLVSARFFRWE